MGRRKGQSLLVPLLLINSIKAWNFNFGTFGLDEDLILFNEFGADFTEDSQVYLGLWNINGRADLSRNRV